MIRFRLYYDKDKETEWLNDMVSEGWAMKGFFCGFYKFEKCEKGEYIYQIDFGDTLYSVSDEYRELMNDLGVEGRRRIIIGSRTKNRHTAQTIFCSL